MEAAIVSSTMVLDIGMISKFFPKKDLFKHNAKKNIWSFLISMGLFSRTNVCSIGVM